MQRYKNFLPNASGQSIFLPKSVFGGAVDTANMLFGGLSAFGRMLLLGSLHRYLNAVAGSEELAAEVANGVGGEAIYLL